jgi:cytochrome c oxidase subunit III
VTSQARAEGIPGSLLGMLLFISSELMFFGSLFGAYFTLRADAAVWPPAGSPEPDVVRTALFSILLISSSVTMQLGVNAGRRDDRRGLVRWSFVTIALGAVFLSGQAWEYTDLANEGLTISSGIYGTAFFALTGFHGFHVIVGLCAIALIAAAARREGYGSRRIGPVEAVSLYWHFVDVIWILLFSTIYLLS